MTALEDLLRARIRAEGPMTFADFMATALYDPDHGYYSSDAPRTGWRGHFVTSPELHSVFARLWGYFFRRVWLAVGRPAVFEIVEVGAGEGSFARSLLGQLPPDLAGATQLHLVEPLPRLQERQERTLAGLGPVRWSASLAEVRGVGCGCVFANEVLDNLPVHLVTRVNGQLREMWVELGAGLQLVPGELSSPALATYLETLELELPEGGQVDVSLELARFVNEAARVHEVGAVAFVDYGVSGADLRAHPRSTLASYFAGGVDEMVLREPGARDVTSHVHWEAVLRALRDSGMAAVGPMHQGEFLRRLGAAREADAAAEEHRRAAAMGEGRTAVRALSRRSAIGLLTATSSLGGLDVCIGLRSVGTDVVPA